MNYTAGNRGEGIRSDCFVNLEIKTSGGIHIDVKSKVKSLYGESIDALCREILDFFQIAHAYLQIEDTGALPFTIAARLEASIRLYASGSREYLIPMLKQNEYYTEKDRQRVSRLYLPGNNPKLMINAGIYGSHGIILDLEDSVAPEKKHEARFLVRNALRAVDFYGAEKMVRINQIPAGLDDLPYCVPHHVNLILIPKCENAQQVKQTEVRIAEISGIADFPIHLMPIIESAKGVLNAYEIASASEHVVALAIGLEDYTADLGVQRTLEGKETVFARNMIVHAAVAAGKQPIDSVFSNIDNMDELSQHARDSRAMGFTGMGCIHPRQVPVINQAFQASQEEIERARKIVLAFFRAQKEGLAVVALDSKMIDPPVVKRALKIMDTAVKNGVIPENWRAQYE